MSHSAVLVALAPDDLVRAMDGINAAVAEQMAPFDEEGRSYTDGSRWDWWQIGGRYSGLLGGSDVFRVGDFDMAAWRSHLERRLRKQYGDAQAEPNPGRRDFIYGTMPGETEGDFLARKMPPAPRCGAFLKARRWNEGERPWWFGTSTATECELAGEAPRRCRAKAANGEGEIITWNEEWDAWGAAFWRRFVEPLTPDTTLVLVDYHV